MDEQKTPLLSTPHDHKPTVQQILNEIGIGKFHYVLFGVIGLFFAQSAIALASFALLLPAAADELNLSPQQQSTISSGVYFGMLIGSSIAAVLGDACGRKFTIVICLSILVTSGILTAFSTNYEYLLISRTLVGVGDGANACLVVLYFIEFLPIAGRGTFLMCLELFWVVGCFINAGLGWGLIPNYGWRVFQASTVVCAFIGLVLLVLLIPESPRYYMVAKQPQKALRVLRIMARRNSVKKVWQFLEENDSDILVQDGNGIELVVGEINCGSGFRASIKRFTSLFSLKQTRYITILGIFWSIALNATYSALVPWLPTLFEHFGSKSISIYAKNFLMIIGSIPGNIASVVLIDLIGRKKSAVCGFILYGLAVLVFNYCPMKSVVPIIAASLIKGMSDYSFNVFFVWSPEIYPTVVRSTALGVLQTVGLIIGMFAVYFGGVLFDIDVHIPLLISAALCGLGALVVLPLPETKGVSLKDELYLSTSSDLESSQEDEE